MKKVKIGLVGAGLIGRDHALSLRRFKEVAQLQLFDADGARAKQRAEELGLEQALSLEALIGDCDIVWICTPPFVHLPVVKQAAAAGKAIFCEKPLSHNAADGKAIAQAVRKAKVPFFVGHSCRFGAGFLLMKKLLDEGAVGTPTLFWSTRIGYCDPKHQPAWRLEDNKSGGAVVELGVHEIDFFHWMGGPLKWVSGAGSSATLKPGQFQDSVVALGRLQSGAAVRLDLSWSDPRYLWQRGISGDGGSMYFDDSRLREVVVHKPGKKPRIYLTRYTDWMDRKTNENLALRDQDRAVIEALTSGGKPPVGVEEGLAAVEVALAIRKASQTGRTVQIS